MTTYIQNKKAHFNFEILDTLEAGLVLHGYEVKGIRAKKGKLEGAHVIVRGGEAYLVGAEITAFQPINTPKDYDSKRPRKLLLSQKELALLENKTETAGLTAVAIRLYNSGRKIKLEIAIARGKRQHDKRESIKARDSKRDIERTLKGQ